MGLFGGKNVRTRAGIFIFGGVMQYVEVTRRGESYRLERCIDAPYDTGSAGGDIFASRDIIETNLKSLKKLVGRKWPGQIFAAIPSKDVLLRTVELPMMDLPDIKAAFRYEFDRFFPIPVDDAIYDISFIDRPVADENVNAAVAHCLAAAVRKTTVENLMTAATRVGIKLNGIEPSPIATLRCLMGPVPPDGYNLYALAGITSSNIIATYKDNGVVFRNTTQSFASADMDGRLIPNFTRDIQSTINFASTQMRGFSAQKVVIGGYGAMLGQRLVDSVAEVVSVPIELTNPWKLWNIENQPNDTYGWETPLGLALRPTEVK